MRHPAVRGTPPWTSPTRPPRGDARSEAQVVGTRNHRRYRLFFFKGEGDVDWQATDCSWTLCQALWDLEKKIHKKAPTLPVSKSHRGVDTRARAPYQRHIPGTFPVLERGEAMVVVFLLQWKENGLLRQWHGPPAIRPLTASTSQGAHTAGHSHTTKRAATDNLAQSFQTLPPGLCCSLPSPGTGEMTE